MRKIFNIWTIIATAVILMGAGTTYYSLKSTDSPIFANIKLSALSDGYIPYHVDDATGFADGPVKADVDDAVSKKHTRSHAISSTSDHSDVNLAAISNNDLMRWDDPSSKWLPKSIAEVVSGNIIDPSNVRIASLTDGYIPYHVDDTTGFADGPTKTDVDDAVSKKHSQNTDTGTTGASFTIESDAPDAGELYLGQDNAGVNGDNSAGIKNDSGTIKYKNKAGDWTAVGAGGGGDVSTDAIWDAAGDLAVGTGANTAAKVSIGAEEIVARIGAGNIDGISVAEQTIVGRKTGGSIDDLSAADVRTILNVADGAEVNNISDVNATDLTDGGDTTLHDHDGISENTAARHTQNTDTGTSENFTMVSGKYLATDKVRAVDGDGLYLVDDGDNGLTVLDGGNVLISGNLGTNEGSYNSIIGSAFASESGYTYCNIVGKDIGNNATGAVYYNQITGYDIADSATGDVYRNIITGSYIANNATGHVRYNLIAGSNVANYTTVNVYSNIITGSYIANATTGYTYQNSITGNYIANSSTGGVYRNTLIGESIAYNATSYVAYNSITGSNIANAATGSVTRNSITGSDIANTVTGSMYYTFSVGHANLYNTTNETNLERVIALPYESLRESSATDLDDAIAIGYRAGYQNTKNNPCLLGRESTATADKQVVIGSSYYTGGILLDGTTTIEGAVYIKEQAAAGSDVAGYGQIWVKDDTPNELYFTDDAGTDTQISSHPLDAPAELYANGPGLDWIGKRVQNYLGVIFWQTLDGSITEETFDDYNLRRKDDPGHVDLVKRDWNTDQMARLRAKALEEMISEEVTIDNAFESVEITKEVEVSTKTKYEYEIDDTGKVKITEKAEPITEMRPTGKFKKQLRVDVMFDSETGKFIRKRKITEAEVDALNLQPPEMPKWMMDWLKVANRKK